MSQHSLQCNFVSDSHDPCVLVCSRPKCGRRLKTLLVHNPSQVVAPCRSSALGLGDRLAWMLSKVGITRESWATRPVVCGGFIATWQVPEKPSGCGCHVRHNSLNIYGWAWQKKINNAGWWVRYCYAWTRDAILRALFRCPTQAQMSEQSTLPESGECQAHSNES